VISCTKKFTNLIWSDEFNQVDGTGPATDKWIYDLGGDGWGNHELETYTNSRENSFVASSAHATDGKMLVIKAIQNPTAPKYTSARIKTEGTFDFKYGLVEARVRIPQGQGYWPAFWTLGIDLDQVGWPACGEIDIMEAINNKSNVYGTVHGTNFSSGVGGHVKVDLGANGGKFIIVSVEWTDSSITFYVNSIEYFKVTPATLPAGAQWIFNKRHFIILNFAIGGDWPGSPNANTVFPAHYEIDYVRVYQ